MTKKLDFGSGLRTAVMIVAILSAMATAFGLYYTVTNGVNLNEHHISEMAIDIDEIDEVVELNVRRLDVLEVKLDIIKDDVKTILDVVRR